MQAELRGGALLEARRAQDPPDVRIGWRGDALAATSSVEPRRWTAVLARITLNDASVRWIDLASTGGVFNRSGDRFKPSVVRSYRASLTIHVLPVVGHLRMAEITRGELQRLVGLWQANGKGPSTIGNAINAIRALYAAADLLTTGAIPVNPCQSLRLPARRGRRNRIASVQEAIRLIQALPPAERAVWGLAFWAGLRHGEIMGLRWDGVDHSGGLVAVRNGPGSVRGPCCTQESCAVCDTFRSSAGCTTC